MPPLAHRIATIGVTMKEAIIRKAEQFIENEKQFHLGFLPTEQSNPLSRTLEADFKDCPVKGMKTLQKVDRNVLDMATKLFASKQYDTLVETLFKTIQQGGRVIFSGCGATGRLSIMTECFWRDACARYKNAEKYANQVESIMTGGDYALVKSVEFFEDYAVFGRRQVQEANMTPKDTLVAITEGGETSSVLGTVAEAVERGCSVFLMFNNPAELLAKHLDRSRQAIENPAVTVLDLYCGPMALAGSTRMQATTSEQLVAGAALETVMHRLLNLPALDYAQAFEKLLDSLETDDSVKALADYASFEASVYAKGGKVTYFANDFLLDIFTDTTERSPTFMLPPFRKRGITTQPAPWTFVKNPLMSTDDAWEQGMKRPLRCLDWKKEDYVAMGVGDKISGNPPALSAEDLRQFAIGNEDQEERYDSGKDAAVLVLPNRQDNLEACFQNLARNFADKRILAVGTTLPDALSIQSDSDGGALKIMHHLAVKLVLNTISTGVMTILGRVSGNWMSWVDCTNKKLLDRGARLLVELSGCDYKTAVVSIFEAIDALQDIPGEKPSPVQVALAWLTRKRCSSLVDYLERFDAAWKLVLEGENACITPDQCANVTQKKQADGSILQTWKGHPDAGDDFCVNVIWKQDETGRFAGRIDYEGYTGKSQILEIEFPRTAIPFDVDASVLFGSWDMGFKLHAKEYFPGKTNAWHRIESMQFGAIIRPHGDSLYYDYRDENWNLKHVRHALDANRIMTVSACYLNPLDETPAPEGCVPYECSVQFYQGDWFEAAQIYKNWGTKQHWVTNRPEKNPLADIDMWIWNRGLVKDVIPPVERLHKDCPNAKLALDWYWWHSNPYDSNYPFFWPPREGEETFKQAVKRLTDQNIYSQVYINGVCWDMDADTWNQGGNEGVTIQLNGTPRAYAFNKFNEHRLAWMCGEAPKHHDQMAQLVRKLHDTGLTGQYMDMIGCATYDPCFNPSHNHKKGGGHYVRDGFRNMVQRIKNENPDYPLTTETGNECYMDLFDGGIICSSASSERMNMKTREMLPLFTAVYHGSFAVFGNYALPDSIPPWDPKWPDKDRWKVEQPWHKLFPDQFFVEMARPLIWGAQPMVCSLRHNIADDPEFAEIYQFILKTANFYHDHKDFLFYGDMLSPDGFSCQEKSVDFFIRMIFTKDSAVNSVTKTLPCILHSCWKNKNGESALILANITDQEQEWSYKKLAGTMKPHSYECIKL